jgi:Na+-driven multidrug efflux pump
MAFARPLLKLYIGASEFRVMSWKRKYHLTIFVFSIGHEAVNTPGLLNSAEEYVKIRALSMPTSLLMGVVQAACLGAKDSVTPLIAVVYSTVVNIFGDYLLVSKLGMGLRGAAIATTLSQVRSIYSPLTVLLDEKGCLAYFDNFRRNTKHQLSIVVGSHGCVVGTCPKTPRKRSFLGTVEKARNDE